MNSIEFLRLDYQSQVKALNSIRNDKIFDDCIYVGSGDSYVAGLIAEFLTDHKCKCYSPSDLFNSRFTESKTYCFISVTGKTKANLNVAKHATEAGVRTIAITSNKNSKLAQVCREIVPLNISKKQVTSASFGTFVVNVVTCLQIAGITVPQKFGTWNKNGMKLSRDFLNKVVIPKGTSLYILGNGALYALALYASFKMAEFFGTSAIAHKLEEFCHSPIFGIKKNDHIWILGQNEESVSQKIADSGIKVSYFELYNSDVFTQIFQLIFFLQSLVLLLAEKNGSTELEYRLRRDLLKCSSDIIYNNSI